MNNDKVNVVNVINGEYSTIPQKVLDNPFFAETYLPVDDSEFPESDKCDVEDLIELPAVEDMPELTEDKEI